MSDAARQLRTRLSDELRRAMKARDSATMAAIRALMTAVDNAGAVPITAQRAGFFRCSGDIPRKSLSDTDCQAILRSELAVRSAAATEFERLGRHEDAERARTEISILMRYLDN